MRARDAGGRRRVERRPEPAERVGREDRVVVQQQDALRTSREGRARACVQSARELPVVIEEDEPHAGAPDLAQPRPFGLTRGVVDDQHGVRGALLR